MPVEEEFGVRNPRKLIDPELPTKKEVEAHNMTHLPYRSCCPHCVAGKGKVAPRFKQVRADGVFEVSFDCCFMHTDGSPLATILVAKERETKMIIISVIY